MQMFFGFVVGGVVGGLIGRLLSTDVRPDMQLSCVVGAGTLGAVLGAGLSRLLENWLQPEPDAEAAREALIQRSSTAPGAERLQTARRLKAIVVIGTITLLIIEGCAQG